MARSGVLVAPWGEMGAYAASEDGRTFHAPAFPPRALVDTLGGRAPAPAPGHRTLAAAVLSAAALRILVARLIFSAHACHPPATAPLTVIPGRRGRHVQRRLYLRAAATIAHVGAACGCHAGGRACARLRVSRGGLQVRADRNRRDRCGGGVNGRPYVSAGDANEVRTGDLSGLSRVAPPRHVERHLGGLGDPFGSFSLLDAEELPTLLLAAKLALQCSRSRCARGQSHVRWSST
jgi:hypothetical protein